MMKLKRYVENLIYASLDLTDGKNWLNFRERQG